LKSTPVEKFQLQIIPHGEIRPPEIDGKSGFLPNFAFADYFEAYLPIA
jgi:hypothetical protein